MKVEFVLVGLTLWNLIISWFVWRAVSHYRHLTKGVSKSNLEKVLESILKNGQLTKQGVKTLKKRIEDLSIDSEFHFQKVGLVKFNPFSELGGNQSFSLAILNGADKGLVITSLHGRQTTRVYTKLINGKNEVRLSEEEVKAVKKAKKGK